MATSEVAKMAREIEMLKIKLDMLTDEKQIEETKTKIADLREKITLANISREARNE
jgi:hypothetical protein